MLHCKSISKIQLGYSVAIGYYEYAGIIQGGILVSIQIGLNPLIFTIVYGSMQES